jgi:hypothetical protein
MLLWFVYRQGRRLLLLAREPAQVLELIPHGRNWYWHSPWVSPFCRRCVRYCSNTAFSAYFATPQPSCSVDADGRAAFLLGTSVLLFRLQASVTLLIDVPQFWQIDTSSFRSRPEPPDGSATCYEFTVPGLERLCLVLFHLRSSRDEFLPPFGTSASFVHSLPSADDLILRRLRSCLEQLCSKRTVLFSLLPGQLTASLFLLFVASVVDDSDPTMPRSSFERSASSSSTS